jgi:hypothetical protein
LSCKRGTTSCSAARWLSGKLFWVCFGSCTENVTANKRG